ncbi:hypothetical protein ACB092_01G161400 [Castanea dentata]
MSSRPVPAFALDGNGDCTNPKNQSISELVAKLRTAYRSQDFDRAEEILVARETKLKREIEKEKKENALLTEKLQMENLDRIYLEDELENQKKALEAALERERKAEEAKNSKQDEKNVVGVLRRRICDLECENVKAKGEVELWKKRFEELGIRVSKLEEDIAMLTDSEPLANNNGGGEVIRDGSDEVRREKKDLNENGVGNFGQNGVFVKIENDGLYCNGNTSREASVGLGFEENGDILTTACMSKEAFAGLSFDSPIKGNGDSQTAGKKNGIIDIVDSDEDCAPEGTSSGKEINSQKFADNVHSNLAVVENGTRMLKRKWDSRINVSENINNVDQEKDEIFKASKRKMEPKQELISDPEGSPTIHMSRKAVSSGGIGVDKLIRPSRQDQMFLRRCKENMGIEQRPQNLWHNLDLDGDSDDSSSSSDSDDDVNDYLNLDQFIPKVQRNRDNQKWEFEANMLEEFRKDEELCMEAVCALYRQHTSVKRSPFGFSLPNNRGFKNFDVARGTTLAEFLIAGDPQKKLRKSVAELEKHDHKGLSDCRRLAVTHAKQLFEIYQKKEDPFFLS